MFKKLMFLIFTFKIEKLFLSLFKKPDVDKHEIC